MRWLTRVGKALAIVASSNFLRGVAILAGGAAAARAIHALVLPT